MPICRRLALIALLATTPAHAAPRYFIRNIASVEDCHREYDRLFGAWRADPWFFRRTMSGDREHALNCLTDGVEELVCNPVSRKLVVAIVVGQTEPACRAFNPALPATVKPIFKRADGAMADSAIR